MFILYFVLLPAFLIVVATSTVRLERTRHQMPPLEREPEPRQIAQALGSFAYIRQGTVLFLVALAALVVVAIWRATQGDTSALELLPTVIVLVTGTLWIAFLAARLRCAALGITNPRTYFRDRANESSYRD